jgi:hypothetical protein
MCLPPVTQLVNPHGRITVDDYPAWTYDWSPRSTLWASKINGPFMRQKLGFSSPDDMDAGLRDGELWIQWEAFLKYFKALSVCKVQIRGIDDPAGVLMCLGVACDMVGLCCVFRPVVWPCCR